MSATTRPRSTRPTPLARKRQRTAAILWAERLAPAIAPALLILLAFITAAWTGLLAPLPPIADLALLIATIALAAALAARGLAAIARPTPQQIDRRLERNHPHRPLATIADRPALPGAEPIWQAHRDRALALVPALHPGPPRLGAQGASAAGAAAVLILLCLLLGAGRGPARLWAALAPPHLLPAAAPLQLQAWIVPPEATGLGPIFLGKQDHDPIPVPIGARLTVSLIGSTSAPSLTYAGHLHRFTRLDHASYQASLLLTSPGALHVALGRHKLGDWRLAVAADQPPTIALTGPPKVQDSRLNIPYAANDDYGLAGITAEIHLARTPVAQPLLLKLPLPGLPRHATGGLLPDLTANPWAGLPIRLHYIVRDGSNQTARSVEILTTLPERNFLNPIARALVAVRRNLVQDPSATKAATTALDRIAVAAFDRLSAGEWLNLRAISALLYERPQASPETEARLWQLAIEIEDQGLNDAKQRLAQARDALRDALAAPPSPAQSEKIAALTRALQQAMDKYLQSMQRQAANADQAPPQQADGRSMDTKQLQQMAQQMADAAKAGRLDEARRRLQQLSALLDSLRPSNRLANQQQQQQKSNPVLDKLLRDQQALRDNARQRAANSANKQTPDPDAQRRGDAITQQALRHRLEDLAGKIGEQNGKVPDGLAHADGAMREAQSAMAQGKDAAAAAAAQRAIDGIRSGSEQMAQGQGKGSEQGQGNGQGQGQGKGQGQSAGRNGPGTDPLGRALGEGGNSPDEADSTLPAQGDAARSRAVRDELRRRAADRTRPPAELNYIERLLQY
jgi:uncharacterized protein (TIGR02302 family)